MNKFKYILILVLAVVLIPVQGLKMAAVQQSSSISVTGTSSLHDWEMKLTSIQSAFNLNKVSETQYEIVETSLSFRAENLKSDNSGMDKKAYEALNTDKHPVINFSQTEKLAVTLVNQKFTGKVKGNLTISGKTKPIELSVTGIQQTDGSLKVNGEVGLKMTDYGVTPPRAMLGAIRAGDDIKVKFDVSFQ